MESGGLEGATSPDRDPALVRGGPTEPGSVPLDLDGVRTVLVGTVAWAIALVVLLFFRDDLADRGETWWLWTCVAGFGLGLLGFQYCRRRRDRITVTPGQ